MQRVRDGRANAWGAMAIIAASVTATAALSAVSSPARRPPVRARASTPGSAAGTRPAAQLLGLINDYRRAQHAPPLVGEMRLQAAASWYADDMARNDSFSHTHTDSLGRPPEDRFRQFRYQWAVAEVSAVGPTSPAGALANWKLSPGHNAILIDPRFHQVGVGIGVNPVSPDHFYWAVSLGTGPGARTSLTILIERPRSRHHAHRALGTARSSDARLPELALSHGRQHLRVDRERAMGAARMRRPDPNGGRAR